MRPSLTVSVVLPNFNHAKFLPHAFDALAAQTRPADEIIVVDDASTDDSVAVIEHYQKKLPQMRLLRNSANAGVAHATNRGVLESRSSHVVCTAADDWLEPPFIERMAAALSRFPEAPFCVSQYVEYDEARDRFFRHDVNSDLGCWFAEGAPEFISPERFCALLDRRLCWLPFNAALIRRDLLLEAGGFDPALKWHCDWFLIYTIALRHGFAVLPEAHAVFRLTPGSFSGQGMKDRMRQRQICLALYDKLKRPEYRDVLALLARHPSPLAFFMRHLIIGLSQRPADWSFLMALLRWWLVEVAHGRRPGFVRDFIVSRRGHL